MSGTREIGGMDLAAAEQIRVIAARLKMTQAQVADAAGIPRSSFNRYWKGERAMTIGELSRVLNALGTTYAQEADEIDRLERAGDNASDDDAAI